MLHLIAYKHYKDKIAVLSNIIYKDEKCPYCGCSFTHIHAKDRIMCDSCDRTFQRGQFCTKTAENILEKVLRKNNVYVINGNVKQLRKKYVSDLSHFKEAIKNRKNTYVVLRIEFGIGLIFNPRMTWFVIENDVERLQWDRENKLKRVLE